ncbi:MAG: DUF1329 domain-containing protein, partial [Candidatus Rokubacteria bacterium]|nr:DUF1329 domain-containing protein [Candidatus Rokubacteria bacterium]
MNRTHLAIAFLAALAAGVPTAAPAAEDAGALAPTFKPGDVITIDQLEKIRPFLPEEFWDNRDFFVYEGMKMEIAPTGDYSTPPEFDAATAKFKGQPRIGPDNSLENYVAGLPFDSATIDCKGDPQAGVKWMYNFDNQWDGDGSRASYFYSYWDRGEQLPLYYEGSAKTIELSARVEKEYLDAN